MMYEPSKYWTLIRVDAAEAGKGYKLQFMPLAQTFFSTCLPNLAEPIAPSETAIQQQLLRQFQAKAPPAQQMGAELCLRCYISLPILQSCFKRARLFGAGHGFTYRDLLPFVLNDDGKPQTQFVPFSVEILRSFSPEHQTSLAGWADLRVRRNPELNQFLLDCGLRFTSDWALLNRANPNSLTDSDRTLVEVFHAVYRRDRPQHRCQGGHSKCLDPTEAQLREMLQRLRHQQTFVPSPRSLLNQLKRIAQTQRQEEVWGRRGFPVAEPLETIDSETGETHLRDIPDATGSSDPEVSERSELQQFCHDQLLHSLDQGIRQAITDRIHSLKQRPRYADFASQVQPALRLLYFEGKSQGQIAVLLGMTSQSQVSRILNPKELLVSIRQRTLETLLQQILAKVRELNLVEMPLSPDYFSNLVQHLEAFVDEQIFQAAVAEMSAGHTRSMTSVFAQRLRQILAEHCLAPAA